MIFIITLISITLFILYKVFHTDQDTDFDVPKRTSKNKAYFDALERQKRYDDFWKNLPDIKPSGSYYDYEYYHKEPTYAELLQCQEWFNFRRKVLNNQCCCEWCGTKQHLQVHHKLYYRTPDNKKIAPWHYNLNEVMVLCENCHKQYHSTHKVKLYRISYTEAMSRKYTC